MQILTTIFGTLKRYAGILCDVRSLVVIFLLASRFVAEAQSPLSREYQLKAIFLFNFTQFVEWPVSSFSSAQSPMTIGVLGQDPFGAYLEEAVSGESMNGHPLAIRRCATIEEAESCQILFINLPDKKKRGEALAALSGKNILTVSDAPDFLHAGGMIRFFTRDGKIKLEVNVGATKTANLVISSKLLRLVEIFDR